MSELSRKTLFNIPNMMTYGRITVIPIIVLFMLLESPRLPLSTNRWYAGIAAILFILAAISDVIDGYYARRYKMVSLMGKFFDPMADKLVHMAAMIVMISMGRINALLVLIILLREFFITGLRAVAAGEGIIIGAERLGKFKTISLNIGLSAMLIHYDFLGIPVRMFGLVFVVLGAALAIVSGGQYLYMFFNEVSKRK